MEEKFYIQDTRQYHGNAVVWWGPYGRGYTSRIQEAGLFSKEEALKICERKTDVAWPRSYIDFNKQAWYMIIDIKYLNDSYKGIDSKNYDAVKV